jgi:hypothetical protein
VRQERRVNAKALNANALDVAQGGGTVAGHNSFKSVEPGSPLIPPSPKAQAPQPELGISLDKLTYIIELAREYDVKEGDSDPNSGSNPVDDFDADILEDQPGDPTAEELADAIRGLNEDEQIRLVALAWLGRGTYDIDEWRDAVRTARDVRKPPAAE